VAPESEEVLTIEKQVKKFGPKATGETFANGDPRERMTVYVQHDDFCGNGHNTFHIRGRVEYCMSHNGKTIWREKEDCHADSGLIEEHFPEMGHLIKWNGCHTDSPLYYIENTIYHAGDEDHWGLKAGEEGKIFSRDGTPILEWRTKDGIHPYELGRPDIHSKPMTFLPLQAVRKGEGKERDLDSARKCAVWPDATDFELTAPGLRERLEGRLPYLMEEFKRDVEALGLEW
jgi:hypothetical protein